MFDVRFNGISEATSPLGATNSPNTEGRGGGANLKL
jgi:hypothetical protein